MPVLTCNNCGGTTNTAVSKFNLRDHTQGASCCYAKYEDGEWIEGCAYKDADKLYFNMAKKLIKGGETND